MVGAAGAPNGLAFVVAGAPNTLEVADAVVVSWMELTVEPLPLGIY